MSVINTNVASLNAQRNLAKSGQAMQTSLQRLSSGLRINSAKDDAAGLAIANRFTTQIRGLNQAVRNANDGISVAQVAEGALQESTSILQRMSELAVQAANGSNSTSDRTALNNEVTDLKAELTRISDQTRFGDTAVLDGTFTNKAFQVGVKTGETITISIGDSDATALSVNSISIATATGASSALAKIANAITTIDNTRASLGAKQNRFSSTIANLNNIVENVSAARSRVQDADYARETAELTRNQILQQAGTAMLAQANQLPQSVLSLLQ